MTEANIELYADDQERSALALDTPAATALNRSEIESQLSAAHRYPRSIGRFLKEATTMATLSQEVAESCIYTLPRDGKAITGPSVRLAEIIASAYGNMHVATRVLDADATEIAAQGVAWDLERNYRASAESRRRITKRSGERYNDDMIVVTGNAAASIAFRNAVFRVVPRAYVMSVYAAVRACAVGTAQTIGARRENALARFGKLGVAKERVLARLGKATVEDVTLENIETLIGIHTSIREGASIESHFPEATPQPKGDAERSSVPPSDLEARIRAVAHSNPVAESPATQELRVVGDRIVQHPPSRSVGATVCPICDQLVGADGIPTRLDSGKIALRHPACNPLGVAP